jgi:hypothetical protein
MVEPQTPAWDEERACRLALAPRLLLSESGDVRADGRVTAEATKMA